MEPGSTLTWPGAAAPLDVLAPLTGPGAPFELTVETVRGVPLQVFAQRPRHLGQLLASAASRFADRPYLVYPERTVTFGEWPGLVAAVAASLRHRHGIGPGDRVAVASANSLEFALTFWATTVLGGVTVALNAWSTASELDQAIAGTRPALVCADRSRMERLDPASCPAPVVELGPDLAAPLDGRTGAPVPDVDIDEDDPFLILFTSGTTGRPRGALLSHRNQIHFMWSSILRAMEGAAGGAGPVAEPRTISAAPYFHISGLNAQLIMATATGLTIVHPPPGRWDETTHLALTERHRATSWGLVPTQLWRLLECPELGRFDLSSLRSIGGGSAVWPPELLRRLEQVLPAARRGLSLGYGMTETDGLGLSLSNRLSFADPGSLGEPSPGVEVQIRDPEGSRTVADGQPGEICLRSASVFLGYWQDPDATAAVLDDQGWYRTGDLGAVRDGRVYLAGRRRDVIIRGGENIYPVEIENRLVEHPDVVDAAVVGVEHRTLGQEPHAFVVSRPGSAVTAADVQAWAAERLAPYKVPVRIEWRDDLPRNPSGKVMKHLLVADTPSPFVEE